MPDVKLAGLNRYEAAGEDVSIPETLPRESTLAFDFDSGQAAHNTLAAIGFNSDLGFGADEVDSAEGDSGGPVFINAAVAVNSFGHGGFDTDLLPDVTGTWGELSLSTRVSSFHDFLATATDGQVVFIPEPGGMVLVIVGVWLTIAVRPPFRSRNGSTQVGHELH